MKPVRGAWRKTCKIKSFKIKEGTFDIRPGYTITFMDRHGLSHDHYSLVGVMGATVGQRVYMYEATRW